jgi:hypothetical protein
MPSSDTHRMCPRLFLRNVLYSIWLSILSYLSLNNWKLRHKPYIIHWPSLCSFHSSLSEIITVGLIRNSHICKQFWFTDFPLFPITSAEYRSR